MRDDWSAYAFTEIEGIDNILCVRQRLGENEFGPWEFPGGKRELFEKNPYETLIREVYEEMGILIQRRDIDDKPLHVHNVTKKIGEGRQRRTKEYAFLLFRVRISPAQYDQRHSVDPTAEETGFLTRTELENRPDFKYRHRFAYLESGVGQSTVMRARI